MASKTMAARTLRLCRAFPRENVFVAIDAHSKWPEVIEMTSITAQRTIVEVRRLFSTSVLPEQVVTDNGPTFVADEFQSFLKRNGVQHI